jgi:hypothetical protein
MLNYSPYTGGTNQNTPLHLSTLLSQAGKTWKSYQEDIDLARNSAGQVIINVPLPQGYLRGRAKLFRPPSFSSISDIPF